MISVVVLNFNGGGVLKKCLDALLGQTYADYEIVVLDNGSQDDSLKILQSYLASGKLAVVQSLKNRGCPGGRNLAVRYTQGEIIAFVDNDGYVDSDWLKNIADVFAADPDIGAVASTVFFAKKKNVLNGAGGTVNLQGYGSDHCYHTPYEFAVIPTEALYPMGCGMAIRRSVWDHISPLDEALPNYYDDVELGMRVWKSGYRVVVAQDAWIDHEFNYSAPLVTGKAYLTERGRIRTVLKYWPGHLLPTWMWQELQLLRRSGRYSTILLKALLWNLLHMWSALGCRRHFRRLPGAFIQHCQASWGSYPPPHADNQSQGLNPARASQILEMGKVESRHYMNYGWYHLEDDSGIAYCWTEAHASAVFRIGDITRELHLDWIPSASGQQEVLLSLRILGEVKPIWEVICPVVEVGWRWQHQVFTCELNPGTYELVLTAMQPFREASGRMLGMAISEIAFC
jgi:GT2 family glycosyltransferase